MRRTLFAVLSCAAMVLGKRAALANSACNVPSARDLLGGARFVAIATATMADELRVDTVLYGSAPRKTFDTKSERTRSCVTVQSGQMYLLAEICDDSVEAECVLALRELAQATGDLEFLRNRHFVTRDTFMEQLRLWND